MSDIYAMRRANGDWFALEDHKRLRVPLFHSSHDAMMARLRNFGMLLFAPVALNARLLTEIAPLGGGSDVDFFIVKDPFASLSRVSQIAYAQLTLLISNLPKHPSMSRPEIGFQAFGLPLPQVASEATETWEDEGGNYVKCA